MLIKQGKTNIKYLLIIIVLAAVIGSITFVLYDDIDHILYQISPWQLKQLYGCETDTDCVLVQNGWCKNVIAINKNKETEWNKENERQTENARQNKQTCKPTLPKYLDINNFLASCQQSNCKAVFIGDETADWEAYKIVTDDSGRIVVAKINYPTEFRGVFMDLHIVDNQINSLSEPEIVNGYPNYLRGSYDFMARAVSFNDDILGEYGFWDPRIIMGEPGYQGPTWRDSADFSLIIPYFEDIKTINIFSATKLMFSVDVSYLTSE